MRRSVYMLCLLVLLEVASAQNGFLRVLVCDESNHPVQAVVEFYRQTYDFCKPWSIPTISEWYSLFLTCTRELGREPTLREWRDWLIRMGVIAREQLEAITDERGELVCSVHPNIYSVYAWSPGYGVACAHHVLVCPSETTEVTLTLPRVPITMLKAQLVFPSPLNFLTLTLMRDSMPLSLARSFLLSDFVQFPLAQWHPRSPGFFELGRFSVVFEADGKRAQRRLLLENWGKTVDLGTIEFSPKPRETNAEKRVPVTVQVFWSDGKTPASGVKVNDKMTNRQGRVQIELWVGGNELSVRVPRQFWQKGMTSFHWVFIAPETRSVKIVLPKPASVRGVVRYENGIPAVNAEVSLSRLINGGKYQFSWSEDTPDLTVRTDDEGAFALPAVPPGEFSLKVWDGAISFKRDIFLQSGQSLHLAITLRLPQKRKLVGEVKLPSGEPASRTVVVMNGKFIVADENGRFETMHWVTEEPVFVWLPGKGSAFRWLPISPSPEPLTVPITLESGSVVGQLVDEQNRPITKASVRLQREGFYFTGLLATHTDAEGRFKIAPVPSGRWQLVVEGPVGFHFSLPALVKTIEVPPNGTVEVGVLKVPTKVGQIVGCVVFPHDFGKRKGERTVQVCLQPENWHKEKTYLEISPSKPDFPCFPLPPGNYWLLAQGGSWSSKPQKVVIPKTGGIVPVKVQLLKAGSLIVSVHDSKTGKPVEASVRVLNENGVELSFGFTDSEGNALLENIAPGTYTLNVNAFLYQSVKLPVSIVAGQVSNVIVRLEPKP